MVVPIQMPVSGKGEYSQDAEIKKKGLFFEFNAPAIRKDEFSIL